MGEHTAQGRRPELTWEHGHARRARAARAVVEAATAGVVVGAVGSQRLLWLPLVVAVPLAALAAGQWLWAAVWRRRTTRDGRPVVRAGVPRSLSRRVPDPPSWPDGLVRGVLTVTGATWHWRPAHGCSDGAARVVWDDGNVVAVSVRTTWGGLRPPHALVTLRCPGGPVTVLVHDADRLALPAWQAREHERIG